MTDKAASSNRMDEAALSVTYRIQACHCPLPEPVGTHVLSFALYGNTRISPVRQTRQINTKQTQKPTE